jgi:hypothetical protein
MDSSFGTLRFDPALSKISLGAQKLDYRAKDLIEIKKIYKYN